MAEHVFDVKGTESNICLRSPGAGDTFRPTEQEGSHGV
jgi:hypothetical protein